MSEPRTSAGKALADWNHNGAPLSPFEFAERIRSIEDQAAAEARQDIAREIERAPSWDGDEAFVMLKDVLAIVGGQP